jgi:hypothetical protein
VAGLSACFYILSRDIHYSQVEIPLHNTAMMTFFFLRKK